jgi:hypothetical protein
MLDGSAEDVEGCYIIAGCLGLDRASESAQGYLLIDLPIACKTSCSTTRVRDPLLKWCVLTRPGFEVK